MAKPALQVEGVEQAVAMLTASAGRLADMRLAAPIVNQMLSVAYRERWEEWDGYMYETGRLYESFTDSDSMDAIRKAHVDRIEFGSAVPYARFYAGDLLEVDSTMTEHLADAMADYYEGARMVRGHYRAGGWVGAYVRGGVANPLAQLHL